MVLVDRTHPTIGTGPLLHGHQLRGGGLGGFLAQLQGLAHLARQFARQGIQHIGLGHTFDLHTLETDPLHEQGHLAALPHDAAGHAQHLLVQSFLLPVHQGDRLVHGDQVDQDPPLVDAVVELPQGLLRGGELHQALVQGPLHLHVLLAVGVELGELLRGGFGGPEAVVLKTPAHDDAGVLPRLRQHEHGVLAHEVLPLGDAQGRRHVLQAAGQTHGVAHGHRAADLLNLQFGPAKAGNHREVPDGPLERRVVGVDEASGADVPVDPVKLAEHTELGENPHRLVVEGEGHAVDAGAGVPGVVV